MFDTAKNLIEKCNTENKQIYEVVLEYQMQTTNMSKEEIYDELYKILEVMENSATHYLEEPSKTATGMIDGFGYLMNKYSEKGNTLTGNFMNTAMAMAFSTLEMSANMFKIVAAPTAGASGILPAGIISLAKKNNISLYDQANALLTAVGLGEYIARYANFSGAEGGCQAECGSAAAMTAGALVFLMGGTPEQSLHAGSFALIHVLGLICDPIAGLVEYPCTFRNASGVVNAMISADMALAGVKSIVPFEEVVKTMEKVGNEIPITSRETGLGGLAATETGCRIRKDFLGGSYE